MSGQPYDDAFFDEKEGDVLRSARVIVPLVLELVPARSVVDVGCGRGAWLSVFREHGVEQIAGLDGDHVNRERLLIDPALFDAVDLSQAFDAGGPYDLAVCLEVVEHLPAAAGPAIVAELTRAAPVVLFSAALPGQGGTDHVNERWPRYWEQLFDRHDYVRVDCIRRSICYDTRVKWWYRQNVTIYASHDAVARHAPLRAALSADPAAPLEWVHVKVFERQLMASSTVRGVARSAPKAVRALLRRQRFRGPNDTQ